MAYLVAHVPVDKSTIGSGGAAVTCAMILKSKNNNISIVKTL